MYRIRIYVPRHACVATLQKKKIAQQRDSVAEWSKALDSSSNGANRVGSNPTAVKVGHDNAPEIRSFNVHHSKFSLSSPRTRFEACKSMQAVAADILFRDRIFRGDVVSDVARLLKRPSQSYPLQSNLWIPSTTFPKGDVRSETTPFQGGGVPLDQTTAHLLQESIGLIQCNACKIHNKKRWKIWSAPGQRVRVVKEMD